MFIARIAATSALLASVAVGAGAAIDIDDIDAAISNRAATRDVPFDPHASCDMITVAALAGRHPGVRQFVVVQSANFDATTATVEVAVRDRNGSWRCQRDPQNARVGKAGTRPLIDRRSGDGTAPAGVFPLGVVTAWDGETFSMFGNQPDPGVLVPYRSVRYEDCWGAIKNTWYYQHLVNRPGCTGPDEWLRTIGDVYAHAAVIGANLDPISGDAPGETPFAAAIFLHRHSYTPAGATRPTSGCVSLAIDDLIDTIRLIDPDLSPHFAIGPTDWLRTVA